MNMVVGPQKCEEPDFSYYTCAATIGYNNFASLSRGSVGKDIKWTTQTTSLDRFIYRYD